MSRYAMLVCCASTVLWGGDYQRFELPNGAVVLYQVSRGPLAFPPLKTPFAGLIHSMTALHPGEILKAGTAIAQITPVEGDLVIETWLPANERRLVHEGQKVRVQAERGESFQGEVISISPTYRVLIKPAQFEPALCDGMTLQIHFITRQERLLWILF